MASVNTSGIVTAVAPGNAIVTVTDGDSYAESIPILVVENADNNRLAVDLKVDKTCQLTMDDYTNTFAGTWTSMDPAVATVSSSGKVKAAGAGLALVTRQRCGWKGNWAGVCESEDIIQPILTDVKEVTSLKPPASRTLAGGLLCAHFKHPTY